MLALLAIATMAQAQVVLDETNFPDANFRAALAEILRISEGDEITAEKIAATTSLNVFKESIADLTGIEHFTALTELRCYSTQLTSLDLSKNTALTYLLCVGNQLTSLDVSGCTALKTLICQANRLTSLDVSKNTALTRLECFNNCLTSLDLSKNTALTWLSCNNNQLTSLDVTQNTELYYLSCTNNQLTSLDVSKNTALTILWCDSNQLTSLDVSQNPALTFLSCFNNQIKGEAMDVLVASLPTVEDYGYFYVIDTKDENEGNVCTKSQVAVAKEKGWTVYDYNGDITDDDFYHPEYEGSEDTNSVHGAEFTVQSPDENWYTIDGIKLNGEPTKKGIYVVKGKKVKR